VHLHLLNFPYCWLISYLQLNCVMFVCKLFLLIFLKDIVIVLLMIKRIFCCPAFVNVRQIEHVCS